MARKQTIYGPYRVKDIGVGGHVYEVVCMVDNQSNTHQELIPRYTTLSRQAAFGKCARLNRRWQADVVTGEPEFIDVRLQYWKEATN